MADRKYDWLAEVCYALRIFIAVPPVRQRSYRKCVEWNEGMCVEYDKNAAG